MLDRPHLIAYGHGVSLDAKGGKNAGKPTALFNEPEIHRHCGREQ